MEVTRIRGAKRDYRRSPALHSGEHNPAADGTRLLALISRRSYCSLTSGTLGDIPAGVPVPWKTSFEAGTHYRRRRYPPETPAPETLGVSGTTAGCRSASTPTLALPPATLGTMPEYPHMRQLSYQPSRSLSMNVSPLHRGQPLRFQCVTSPTPYNRRTAFHSWTFFGVLGGVLA